MISLHRCWLLLLACLGLAASEGVTGFALARGGTVTLQDAQPAEPAFLRAENPAFPNDPTREVVWRITLPPVQGQLVRIGDDGSPNPLGDAAQGEAVTFTQADIGAGRIRYRHNAANTRAVNDTFIVVPARSGSAGADERISLITIDQLAPVLAWASAPSTWDEQTGTAVPISPNADLILTKGTVASTATVLLEDGIPNDFVSLVAANDIVLTASASSWSLFSATTLIGTAARTNGTLGLSINFTNAATPDHVRRALTCITFSHVSNHPRRTTRSARLTLRVSEEQSLELREATDRQIINLVLFNDPPSLVFGGNDVPSVDVLAPNPGFPPPLAMPAVPGVVVRGIIRVSDPEGDTTFMRLVAGSSIADIAIAAPDTDAQAIRFTYLARRDSGRSSDSFRLGVGDRDGNGFELSVRVELLGANSQPYWVAQDAPMVVTGGQPVNIPLTPLGDWHAGATLRSLLLTQSNPQDVVVLPDPSTARPLTVTITPSADAIPRGAGFGLVLTTAAENAGGGTSVYVPINLLVLPPPPLGDPG